MTIDASTRGALERIDHALAVQDAAPVADERWQPGDPLHRRSVFARPMFELMDDGAWGRARCKACEVSWVGSDPCWMCGKAPAGRGYATVTVELDETAFTGGLRGFAEQVARDLGAAVDTLYTVMRDAAISEELVRVTLGVRGPDRPELVVRYAPGGFISAIMRQLQRPRSVRWYWDR